MNGNINWPQTELKDVLSNFTTQTQQACNEFQAPLNLTASSVSYFVFRISYPGCSVADKIATQPRGQRRGPISWIQPPGLSLGHRCARSRLPKAA